MSEYCYQCLECGRFKEDCICKYFHDPLEPWKDMTPEKLLLELQQEDCL